MERDDKTYSYVDAGECVQVMDPMHENTDEDMTDEEWQRFSQERLANNAQVKAA